MKHVIRIALMVLFIPMAASAQWQFAGVFPDSTINTNAHGLAVDTDGKVWVGNYYNTLFAEESERRTLVRVFESDGTEADFSPLWYSTVGDSTLRFGAITGLNVGIDGNIYLSSHGYRFTSSTSAIEGDAWNQLRSFIHVIDSQTGQAERVIELTYPRIETSAHAPNRVAVTEDGFVVVSFVFGASPILILDPNDDWNILNTVTTNKFGISRTVEVSADGTQIFNPQTEPIEAGGAPGHIQVLESSSVFDEYSVGNPLIDGAMVGAISRYPNSEILYFSGGGIGGAADATEPLYSNTYYGFSLNSRQIIDEFSWNYGEATTYQVPRSIAFSHDGLTAYVGSFNNGPLSLQKFTRSEPVSIERGGEIASGFALEQNYPNPFNPTTTISYTLGDAGMTTIRVYDMLGRVVATLVNQEMPAGTHNVNFNAANLGSGIYLYELTSGNVRLTNKMTLVK